MPFKRLALKKDLNTKAVYFVCIEYDEKPLNKYKEEYTGKGKAVETEEYIVKKVTYERFLDNEIQEMEGTAMEAFLKLYIDQIDVSFSKIKNDPSENFKVQSKSKEWEFYIDVIWLDRNPKVRANLQCIFLLEDNKLTLFREAKKDEIEESSEGYNAREQIRWLRKHLAKVYEHQQNATTNNNNNNVSRLAPRNASPIHVPQEFNHKNWNVCAIFKANNEFYCIYKRPGALQFVLMPMLEPWKFVYLDKKSAGELGNYIEGIGFTIPRDIRNSSLVGYFRKVEGIAPPFNSKDILKQHFQKLILAYKIKDMGMPKAQEVEKSNACFKEESDFVIALKNLTNEEFFESPAYRDNAVPIIVKEAGKIFPSIGHESEQSPLLETSSNTSSCCTLV